MDFFKQKVEEIRKKRNEMLLKTDYLLLPDSNIYNDEVKLNLVKQYRQKLRDFLNQLMNEKIDTNMFLDIDDYVDAYFPKLNV